jgi:hypothetical protein
MARPSQTSFVTSCGNASTEAKEKTLDLFKPRGAAAPRRPTDNNQQNGVITNTPRFAQLGGLSAPGKIGKMGMAVQKPGDGKKVI